jgi:HTH-type transcriptional regulator / antitoxin HipB
MARTPKAAPEPAEPTLVKEPKVLGQLIRGQRKRARATLVQAAGLTGVGVRFLLELEHGKPTAALGKTLQVLERMGLQLWVVPRGKRPWGA